MKEEDFVSLSVKNKNGDLSPCHYDLDESNSAKISARCVTQKWLQRKSESMYFNPTYFLTLSFFKGSKSPINQYGDNKHIKKVILDFFYPSGKKPKDRLRLWFFVERHYESRKLHLHILMERPDGISWLMSKNRKITLSKDTLFQIIADDDYNLDDVMSECLTNHLKTHIKKLGLGKKSTNHKKIGDIATRLRYVNKSFDKIDFDCWEHIDIQNSDL